MLVFYLYHGDLYSDLWKSNLHFKKRKMFWRAFNWFLTRQCLQKVNKIVITRRLELRKI